MSHKWIGNILEEGSHWDERFLGLAAHISAWSKDPSTKVGAVIVDEANRIVSLGFNGFPRGVRDTPERYGDREEKLHFVVHGDANAILFAGRSVVGCRMYTYPFPPCHACAGLIVQAGIREVIAPYPSEEIIKRWERSLEVAATIFDEGGVALCLVAGRFDYESGSKLTDVQRT